MGILQQRLKEYTAPQMYKQMGIYPYFREITGRQGAVVTMEGKEVLMFGSNAYTGLNADERVIQAGIRALETYGSTCSGSRFLNGTLDIHVQLEREIADFVGKESAMVLTTGFTSNSGVIPALVRRNDYILSDARCHASIIDGKRLSFARQLRYKHNDMEDLERLLQSCAPDAVKLIVMDSVFSMEGDIAPLEEVVRLKRKYNATILIDEAHSIGVFGDHGRGLANQLGVTDDVDIIVGTFSKSLASLGGFVAADESIINYLRHNARTYIFSASLPPASTACVLEALHILENEQEIIDRLWDVTHYALRRFREEGFEIGDTQSPIIPLFVRDTEKTFQLTKMAFDEGVFINPVIPPACDPQDTLVRFALMSIHTHEQVELAVNRLLKCFKALDIIK